MTNSTSVRRFDRAAASARCRLGRHGIGPRRTALGLLGAAALLLAACKEDKNAYVPPPPARVSVATPISLPVPTFIETTGSITAVNQVDLVARVPGFLQQIGYRDGDTAQQGQVLFVIEPAPYQAALEQAQGTLVAAQAELLNAETEFGRQQTLLAQNVSDQARYDDALSKRDQARGKVEQAQGQLQQAQINLGYTSVAAPFLGPVTAHTTSIGSYVGGTTPTTLATIFQVDPIWVKFNISEQETLRIRQLLIASGVTEVRLDQVLIEVGVGPGNEFPIAGTIDYVAPNVDTSTGTQAARGIFANPQRILLPGFFARLRVRMPEGPNRPPSLLIPQTAVGADQSGRYVLVVNRDNVVEQRNVTMGQRFGAMQVATSGLKPDDRVVVNGMQRAIPGNKVDPQPTTLTPPEIPNPVPVPVQPVVATTPVSPSAPAPAPAAAQPAAAPAQPPAQPAQGSRPASGSGGATHSTPAQPPRNPSSSR